MSHFIAFESHPRVACKSVSTLIHHQCHEVFNIISKQLMIIMRKLAFCNTKLHSHDLLTYLLTYNTMHQAIHCQFKSAGMLARDKRLALDEAQRTGMISNSAQRKALDNTMYSKLCMSAACSHLLAAQPTRSQPIGPI